MSGGKKTLDELLGPSPAVKAAAKEIAVAQRKPRGESGKGAGRPEGGSRIQEELYKRISFANVPPDLDQIQDIKLTDNEREFVRWYLVLAKPLPAYDAAYPNAKKNYRTSQPYAILKRAHVRAAIDRLRGARAAEIQFTLEAVLDELWGFNQANVYDYLMEVAPPKLTVEDIAAGMVQQPPRIVMKPLDQLTDLQKRNLKSIKIKSIKRKDEKGEAIEEQQISFEVYDRQKNVQDIAKIRGFLKETHVVDLGDTLVELLRSRAGRHGRTYDGVTGKVDA